jgi:hypothetical protein
MAGKLSNGVASKAVELCRIVGEADFSGCRGWIGPFNK